MDIYHFLISTLIFALPLIILLLTIVRRKAAGSPGTQKANLPPGPKKLPLVGNLHQILGNTLPHISLQELSNSHGPLMFLQLGSIPTLVVSSADVAREIIRSHDVIFSGRPQLYAAKRITYGFVDMVFSPYGQYWRQIRKIAILELLSSKRVKSFSITMEEEVSLMLDSIANLASKSPQRPVNLSMMAISLANNTVCRLAFGRKSSQYEEGEEVGKKKMKLQEILYDTQELIGEVNISDYFPWLSWVNRFNGVDKRLDKTFKELDMFYDQVIKEHYSDSPRDKVDHRHYEDLVDVLLRLQKDPNQDITLTNDHIKGVLTDIFLAGSDSSSATIEWTMTELIKNPSVMEKAQREVRQVVNGKPKVDGNDLPNLKYLNLVLKESFRLHPPVPLLVPRETTGPCKLMGYDIPAKTRVFINAKAIGTDPKCWDDPLKFKPERFLLNPIDFRGQDFELIPFGVGRRSCPALTYAMTSLELALANLLYCFDWKLPQGMSEMDVDVIEICGVTTHKKIPLHLVAVPRGHVVYA